MNIRIIQINDDGSLVVIGKGVDAARMSVASPSNKVTAALDALDKDYGKYDEAAALDTEAAALEAKAAEKRARAAAKRGE